MVRGQIQGGAVILVTWLAASITVGQDSVRIGVWNIEKLSTTAARGFPELRGSNSLGPRSNTELNQMADYIRDELEVDALMVTEIDADSPDSTDTVPQSTQLNHVAERLGPNWKYFLGRTGGDLRLGLLFNTDRIQLKKLVNLHAEPFDVTGRDVLDRDPFIAWVNVLDDNGQTKNDFILICVHLKSIQDRFRNNRMAAIAKLVGDITDTPTRAALQLPSKSEEPEVLILGDCNDSSFDNSGFRYMFDYLAGTGFEHLVPGSGEYPDTRVNGSKIDHIFATKKVTGETMVPDSFRVHAVPDSERDDYRRVFSDHFPVTIDLRVRADDDQTLNEALLIADATARGRALAAMAPEISALVPEGAAAADDEDDGGPPKVSFELIDGDFERILAPKPRPGAAAARSVLPFSAVEARRTRETAETSGPNAALWTAIGVLQEQILAILEQDADLTDADRDRLRRLVEAQKSLVDAIRD